jgi:hypothetical protein
MKWGNSFTPWKKFLEPDSAPRVAELKLFPRRRKNARANLIARAKLI